MDLALNESEIMSYKNVSVVGAGIAGIIAAYFEARKGQNVTLIDSDARAGGLLKSDFVNGKYFDYGTHILSETGEKELDDLIFSEFSPQNCFINNKINVANYFNKRMNEKSCYVNAATIDEDLFNKGCMELLRTEEFPKGDNLEEFLLNKFGKTFYDEVFKPVVMKYIGTHPKKLAVQSGWFFDMSRLLAFDDNITKNLDNLDVYNSKLAHHTRVEGSLKYYPKEGGAGHIIDSLMEKLDTEGVDVKLDFKIKEIKHNHGKVFSLTSADEEIAVDKLIWTLPSSFLSFFSQLGKKTSPPIFRNTGLFDFTFENPLNSLATYINVYDLDMYSGRVTLYQNLSDDENYSCTVEVLTDDCIDLEGLMGKILFELIEMGIVSKNNNCIFKNFRPIKYGFPILTKKFIKEQNELNKYCQSYFQNIIFVGRATTDVFFMKDVLIDAFMKLKYKDF